MIIIYFFRTNVQAWITVKAILQEFCLLVGHKINLNKFELYFSPNCQPQKLRWFNGILIVKCINKPSKYLGIEMGYMKQKKEFFQPLVDKFNQRLAGWRAHLLSQGERLTLIKSTLASLPNYTLSCFKSPK